MIDRLVPVDVIGLNSGVIAVATGSGYSCAITSVHELKCWGNLNGNGPGPVPAAVPGLSTNIIAVEIGFEHACALTGAGGVKCWGNNLNGQLGDGTGVVSVTPVDVVGLASGVVSISAGGYHSCAATYTGEIKCWGLNVDGQIGTGTSTFEYLSPADVSSITSGVTEVTAGFFHTCAVVNDGAKCWGANNEGQIGDGTTSERDAPTNVIGLISGVSAIGGGKDYTCALVNGGVRCWGQNWYGQLGDGSTTRRLTPVSVSGLSAGVAELSVGHEHVCARINPSGVKCWGSDGFGEVGNGKDAVHTAPTVVVGLTNNTLLIDGGSDRTCALTNANGAKCWGYNWAGGVGDGTTQLRANPVDVSGLTSSVMQTTVGAEHSCALTNSGSVKCWGYNYYGQLGDGTTRDRYTAVNVSGLISGVVSISAGGYHTCALTTGGGVKCWGNNSSGQLGDGSTTKHLTPVDIVGLSNGVTKLTAGHAHVCALINAGIKCWGDNAYGQLRRWHHNRSLNTSRRQRYDKRRCSHHSGIVVYLRNDKQWRNQMLGQKFFRAVRRWYYHRSSHSADRLGVFEWWCRGGCWN